MAEIVPDGFVDSVVDWASELGYLGLAIVSASEAALQPVPPDLLVWPMVVGAGSGVEIAMIVFVATISSVFGAILGYGIGMYAGGWILDSFVSDSNIARLNVLIERYGVAGVFIAAVSPIPYKALAWIAGAGRMDLRLFIAAGLFGRGIRFGLAGFLLGVYGETMLESLNWTTFSAVSLIGLAFIVPAAKWWKSLLDE